MNKKRFIAIIPARGGSKRLPNKNLLKIQDKPLLAYTIESALKWGKFDEVYVNSEDQDILSCGKEYGAVPYLRPKELSSDKSKVLEVVKEQIITMNLTDDSIVALLLPTCPLRSDKDLEAAYNIFVNNGCKSAVVSVTKYEKAPEQALLIDKNGKLIPKYPEDYSSRSQDHGSVYRYNTALIFNSSGSFLKSDDIVGSGSIPYIMSFDNSIDIDYEYHIKLVKALMSYRLEMENSNVKI